ncbi:hypothetical protein BACCAP_04025 [Pseudoflavonifractor capillosus ATCC 29799]|uniref:Uncharacterized protein n=1 Tax=Pseudoflavonifractor capillosus ATCC 29799 TaxID=411467 RepID=A6P0L4_9FIRM|nr:hypothetical protein BACCAP_04025 [Pseudoflavonifractor capillosus ATCC 29799]
MRRQAEVLLIFTILKVRVKLVKRYTMWYDKLVCKYAPRKREKASGGAVEV